VFVYRDDQVLLMHRTDDRYWHVVAGVVEYGEAIADAARRELREESGLIGAELLDLGSPVTYPITPELRLRLSHGSGRGDRPQLRGRSTLGMGTDAE